MKSWVLSAVLAGVVGLGGSVFWPIPPGRLAYESTASLQVTDRDGVLLRDVLSGRGGRGRWTPLERVSPHVVAATLAAEDGRFYGHLGVDPLAVARAAWQNLRAGRVVAGGSTISQQVVQDLYGLGRGLPAKVYEAWLALRLERTLSKAQILAQYLNRVPYGNQVFGIEAAARLYFDKPAAHLSVAEAAFLAGLPQAPGRYDPYRAFDRANARQERVLALMRRKGWIDAAQEDRALHQRVALAPRQASFRAPHFVDFVLNRVSPARKAAGGALRTTLDAALQADVELLARGHVRMLAGEGVTNAAVLVMTGDEVLAWVGSADYFDAAHDGQVNGVVALRQPGSALKPFAYGLALERGMTAASVLADVRFFAPAPGGDFSPRNYDEQYHGPVRLRTALACSYNVPAVRVLERMGAELLLHRLRAAGFESLDRPPGYYGLGLVLGNGEVTLLELTRAYGALARGGLYRPERVFSGDSHGEGYEVFSPGVAFLLGDILADADARVPAFGQHSPLSLPFPCAVKTGTSKDFRDNWCVGFTSRYTVGVWVGNFDGQPMRYVSGVTGAGGLFRDVMLSLHRDGEPGGVTPPPGLSRAAVCAVSGMRSGPGCAQRVSEWFAAGRAPDTFCSWHPGSGVTVYPPPFQAWAREQGLAPEAAVPARESGTGQEMVILFPDEDDVFKVDPVLRPEYQTLRLEVAVPPGVDRVVWLVDGEVFTETGAPFSARWPLRPGAHRLQAVATDRVFASRTVQFRVQE